MRSIDWNLPLLIGAIWIAVPELIICPTSESLQKIKSIPKLVSRAPYMRDSHLQQFGDYCHVHVHKSACFIGSRGWIPF